MPRDSSVGCPYVGILAWIHCVAVKGTGGGGQPDSLTQVDGKEIRAKSIAIVTAFAPHAQPCLTTLLGRDVYTISHLNTHFDRR